MAVPSAYSSLNLFFYFFISPHIWYALDYVHRMSFQTIENLCQKYIKKKKRKKALENQSFLLYDDNLLFVCD